LKFDTLVADRRIWYVWPNSYRMQMIRRAARRTTLDNPVVLFTENARRPRSLLGRLRQNWRQRLHDMVASSTVVENGRTQRVRLMREDDYKPCSTTVQTSTRVEGNAVQGCRGARLFHPKLTCAAAAFLNAGTTDGEKHA
jgi:hypothetical protein